MSGFVDDEKLSLLFKKNQGLPSTADAFGAPTDAGLEPIRYAARPTILPGQMWGDQVPPTAPADLALDPRDMTDDVGAPLEGSPIGRASQYYPYIRRFYRLPMQQVFRGTNNFKSWTVATEQDVLLQRSISSAFDSSYMYRLEIKFNQRFYQLIYGASGGHWQVDSDTGVLTFYDFPQVQNRVSLSSPPYISFYRYEGRTGFPYNGGHVDEIGTGALGVQGAVVFNGGEKHPRYDGDALAAVTVDDRNPTTLPTDTFSQAFQLGGDFDGSWRMAIRGGGGRDDITTLEIQNRRNGVWRTQFRINDPEQYQLPNTG